VNDVGVDLNAAVAFTHRRAPLQFVGGLGPRKALALVQAVQRAEHGAAVQSREALEAAGVLGPVVFKNAAGSLRICLRSLGPEDGALDLNPLDDSRVHPELYPIAHQLCSEMLREELDAAGLQGEERTNAAVQMVMSRAAERAAREAQKAEEARREVEAANAAAAQMGEPPEPLPLPYRPCPLRLPFLRQALRQSEHVDRDELGQRDLRDVLYDVDMHAYAEQLRRDRGGAHVRASLELIKQELRFPGLDPRSEPAELRPEQEFRLVTGEDAAEMYAGRLVRGQVEFVQDKFARVRLENGVAGFLPISELSDDFGVISMRDHLREGMLLDAVIAPGGIDWERLSVRLSTKQSALADAALDRARVHPSDAQYFEREPSAEERELARQEQSMRRMEQERREGAGTRRQWQPRAIKHPLFQNLTRVQAQAHLAQRPVGEGLFRPSSKGTDHVTLTWKVDDGVYSHVDIKELDKTSALALGHRLRIFDEIYADMDEVQVRFLEPLHALARRLRRSPKFHPGTAQDIERELQAEHARDPRRVHYLVGHNARYPGAFLFFFHHKGRVRREVIVLHPNGYRVQRQVVGERPQDVINHFKKAFAKRSQSRAPGPAPPAPASTAVQAVGAPTAVAAAADTRAPRRKRWG